MANTYFTVYVKSRYCIVNKRKYNNWYDMNHMNHVYPYEQTITYYYN